MDTSVHSFCPLNKGVLCWEVYCIEEFNAYVICCPLNQRCFLVGLSTNGGFTVHVHNMKMLVSITGTCMNFVTVVYGLVPHMHLTCTSHARHMPLTCTSHALTCISHVCVFIYVFPHITNILDKLIVFMHARAHKG